MGDFEFTQAERQYIEASEVYKRFSDKSFSNLTIATLVTALNAITPSPSNAPLIKWLTFLIRQLAQDSGGRALVIEKESLTLKGLTYDTEEHIYAMSAYGEGASTVYRWAKLIGRLDFTSNAGGNLDADQSLLAAVASYYGVVQLKSIQANDNIAAGATLVVQNGAGVALATLTLPALTANVPTLLYDYTLAATALTTNSAIYIDTTSAALGNAKTYHIEFRKWYERSA